LLVESESIFKILPHSWDRVTQTNKKSLVTPSNRVPCLKGGTVLGGKESTVEKGKKGNMRHRDARLVDVGGTPRMGGGRSRKM